VNTTPLASGARLRICSAVLTGNRKKLEWARDVLTVDVEPELRRIVNDAVAVAPIPGNNRLIRLAGYLPASIQYVGQRAVLVSPRLARRILRLSGLHHQMF
jgi:hypothetical protein